MEFVAVEHHAPYWLLWRLMKPTIAEKNPMARLLSPETLAEKLDCSVKHARALMANGTLPKVRLGRRCVRTTADAVDAFIARRTIGASI